MAYFIIENFAAGLDLRRSIEVAPAGSLRVLRNAFINEGGEIEKTRAFVKDDVLTAYGQGTNYKDRITGPHEVPGYPNSVYFRHRHNSLPSTDWTAGAGSLATRYQTGAGSNLRTFWASKSVQSLTNFGALFHAASTAEFGAASYVVEDYIESAGSTRTRDHVNVDFTLDEPTAETLIPVNANRAFQMVLDQKGYVVLGDILYASAVGDIKDMTSGSGYGQLNFSKNGKPIGEAFGLGDYFGQLVIFGARGVQFYTVDPSFAVTQYQRFLAAFPFAPRTIEGYADGDLMYLSRTGIRSLAARDSSNLAKVDDVGSPIDKLIQLDIAYDANDTDRIFTSASPFVPVADHVDRAISIVHPQTGHFWLFLKGKVYIYARHPGSRVAAWSTLQLPVPAMENVSEKNGQDKGQWAADVCRIGQTIAVRNFAGEVYVYGGDNDTTYDNSETVVETPMMDMKKPGDNKYFTGIDIVGEGEWKIEFTVDPVVVGLDVDWATAAQFTGREPVYSLAGHTEGASRLQSRMAIDAQGMHIAVRLTSRSSYAAKIAQIIVYYNMGAQK